MTKEQTIASIILAAGLGSRMQGFTGSKILLPLIPGPNPYKGDCSILSEIIHNLPDGPKAMVLHHRREQIVQAAGELRITFCDQPIPNGTGGALMAAQSFLECIDQENLIITMGDVPFVKPATYRNLVDPLTSCDLTVLGFKPRDKAQYGVLEIEHERVKRIIEWRYWNEFAAEMQQRFEICNSGIYAAKRSVVLSYINRLRELPHQVEKERGGKLVMVEEYFITDLIELLNDDGLKIGFAITERENEVMGIDTLEDLVLAQGIFAKKNRSAKRF